MTLRRQWCNKLHPTRISMTETSHESHPLPYAEPAPRSPSSALFVMLVIVNAVGAIASLRFLPLITHIYSCANGQHWCHLQAIFFGVPSAVLWLVLLAATVAANRVSQVSGHGTKPLKIAAWLFLAMSAGVLLALFAVVAHNSR